MSVRPSVRLSVCHVRLLYTRAEDIVKPLSLSGGAIILVFFCSERRYPIPKETPSAGAESTWGGEILRFSTEIAVFLRKGMR